MTSGQILARVVTDRLAWVDEMLAEIRSLPLEDRRAFFADRRNIWTAESCLRRALEALLDLGRHILAKGFGQGVSEYKEIAVRLGQLRVLDEEEMEVTARAGRLSEPSGAFLPGGFPGGVVPDLRPAVGRSGTDPPGVSGLAARTSGNVG